MLHCFVGLCNFLVSIIIYISNRIETFSKEKCVLVCVSSSFSCNTDSIIFFVLNCYRGTILGGGGNRMVRHLGVTHSAYHSDFKKLSLSLSKSPELLVNISQNRYHTLPSFDGFLYIIMSYSYRLFWHKYSNLFKSPGTACFGHETSTLCLPINPHP